MGNYAVRGERALVFDPEGLGDKPLALALALALALTLALALALTTDSICSSWVYLYCSLAGAPLGALLASSHQPLVHPVRVQLCCVHM